MGVRNGLWRFTFLGVYFTLVVVSLKGFVHMPEPSLRALIVLHVIWAVWAAHVATWVNKHICALVNEAREGDYQIARGRAERGMPIEALRLDPDTETFVDVRRPLMDPRIGLMRR